VLTVGRARPVRREVGLGWTGPALRVDTFQAAPTDMARFATMNPFHWEPSWRIPVPGQPGRYACSLESIWQGLKVHEGDVDFAMFAARPYKRPPDHARGAGYDYSATRFRLVGDDVDVVTARLLIYLPAYLYLMDRLVPDDVIAEVHGALTAGVDVLFYDWDDNFDICDPRSSFSHSAILAAWFDGDLDRAFLQPLRRLCTKRPNLARHAAVRLDRYRATHRRKVTT
jgi:hypothetical protein